MAGGPHICPTCLVVFRTKRNLDWHQAVHEDPNWQPDPDRRKATAEELALAGLVPEDTNLPQESRPMASNNPETVTKADLEIMELKQKNAALETKNRELEQTATGHQRFRDYIGHVASCPNCKGDVEEYNQKIITQGIEGLSVDAVRDLAFEKGAIPSKFVVDMPEP